jgi:hypothetical protein
MKIVKNNKEMLEKFKKVKKESIIFDEGGNILD